MKKVSITTLFMLRVGSNLNVLWANGNLKCDAYAYETQHAANNSL